MKMNKIGLGLRVFCLALCLWPFVLCAADHASQPIQAVQTDLKDGLATLAANQGNASMGVLPSNVASALLPALKIAKVSKTPDAEMRFNVAANDMPAQDFFMGLVKNTKYNMMVSPRVAGTITLNLQNVTIDDTLQAVKDMYGYQYHRTAYGYQVFPAGLETRTFTVNYLDISRTAESNMSVSSGQIGDKIGANNSTLGTASTSSTSGSGTVNNINPTSRIRTQSDSNFWQELQANIQAMIGTKNGRAVIVNSAAGLVTVRAYPNEFKGVAEYLDSLQANMSREVILEAKILEVKLKTEYNAGIDWSVLGLRQATSAQPLLMSGLPFTGSIFTLDASFHAGEGFSALVNLLEGQGVVQTLSNPRIATLNNQTAVIKVGEDEFFITNVSNTTTTTTGTDQNTQDINLTPFFSGISLDVTPQIDVHGDVILHIHPVVSEVTDQTKTFKVGGQEQELPLALSRVRESDNIVRAENGQIVVIGGLMENDNTQEEQGTPVLSKIPLLGALFHSTNKSTNKTELVILLRPLLLNQSGRQSVLAKTNQDLTQFNDEAQALQDTQNE